MTTTDPTTDPATPTDPPAPPAPTTDAVEVEPTPGSEAAKHRTRAREAEQARDTFRGQVELLQRLEVERIASSDVARPEDVLELGSRPLADLLDDRGAVDAARVAAAVAELLAGRPGLARMVPTPPPGLGQGNHSPAGGGGGATWANLLRGSH